MTGEHRQNLLAIEESFRVLGTRNAQVSALCSTFTTTLGSAVAIENLTVDISTQGGPVLIGIQEIYSSTSDSGIVAAANCKLIISRSKISGEATDIFVRPIVGNASVQSVAFTCLDQTESGQYTYIAKIVSANATLSNIKLFALENK